MNLTDLRDELSQRADTVNTPDLLPGVRRRIRTTKRRRVAGSLTAVAAVVALGIAVAPSLTTTTPDPAENTPADYTRDSVTLKGVVGTDRLEKAWIGSVGESRGSFSWTPNTNNIAIHAYCAAPGQTQYSVLIGGRNAVSASCNVPESATDDSGLVRPDAAVWLDVPQNQATTVTIQLTDENGRAVESSSAQLGIGIYTAGKRDLPGAVDTTPAPNPNDREEEGLRFRGTVGGDTLLTAAGGKPGVNRLSGSYTATGRPIQISSFCTANDARPDFPYSLRVSIDGVEKESGCVALSTDLGKNGSGGWSGVGTPGQRLNVTAELIDKSGRVVTVPGARIGFAVYEKGPQRMYDGTSLDERTEYLGATYQLADVQAVDAATTRETSLRTPEGTPFLVTYGSSELGGSGEITGTLDGLSGQGMLSTGYGDSTTRSWGLATDGNWPGPSRTATLKITQGTPTKGKLILAIYTPAK